MKTCPQCGRFYSDASTMCPKCGISLPQGQTPPPPPPPPPYNPSINHDQHANDSRKPDPVPPPNPNPSIGRVAPMSFIDALTLFFKNYANFKGRSRRKEWLFPALFTFCVNLIISMLIANASSEEALGVIGIVYRLFNLAMIIPNIAVCIRRLHDTGKKGTYYLWCFTIIGAIPVMIALFSDSQPGQNEFGPNPKYY